jgi:CBS domain containing-hemolysin-like protein
MATSSDILNVVLVTACAVVALLVAANALFVAAEFATVGARRSRVRRLAEDGHPRARRLLPYIEQPAALVRYLSASQIGITLSSLTLGAYAEARFGGPLEALLRSWFALDAAGAHYWGEAAVLVALTVIEVVIGELVPKSIALQHPTEVALFTVWPMRWSLAVFRPFAALLNATATLVLRLFGSSMSSHRHIHSPDEIELLIAESRDGGLLEPEEHRRLHKALHLGLRSARDLMVPHQRLTMLPVDTPWSEIVRFVASTPFSRIPIYRESPHRIIGTLRVKDLAVRYVAEGPLPLQRLVRPVIEVSQDLPADRVLALLRERRVHQGVVVDTPGHAIGLITIQDVLTELLGGMSRHGAPR